MGIASVDEWWLGLLEAHEADGRRDAEHGIFDPPYPGSEEPDEADENHAYKRGFDQQRKEMGEGFRWA